MRMLAFLSADDDKFEEDDNDEGWLEGLMHKAADLSH